MIIIELPMLYVKNYEEWLTGQEQGMNIEIEEEIINTCFCINENMIGLIRINAQEGNKERSAMYIDEDNYIINLDYDTLRLILKDELVRVRETPLTTNDDIKENGLESFTLTLKNYWQDGNK